MRRAQLWAIVGLFFVLPTILLSARDTAASGAGAGTAAATATPSPQPPSSANSGASGSASAMAQNAAGPAASPTPSKSAAPAQLPAVVVTATRLQQPIAEIGTTVTVVDSSQIESQKIEQVNNVLRQVPGLELTQSGSPGTISDVFIRGASPAQTLILIDGVEVNSGTTGGFDLADLTTDDLDRVEVVRGAGGALYGSQAVGGVINFITKEGQGPPQFSLLSEGGNRATERQALTFGGSQDRLSYSGAISYFSATGFRPINDSSDDLAGNLRLDYHLDADTTIRGFARYYRSNVSLVNFSNFVEPIDPDAHQRSEFMLFNGEIERHLTDRLTARISASYLRNEVRLNNLPDPGNPVFETDDIPEEIRGTNMETVYSWAKGFRTLAGFDFKDRWARSGDHFIGFRTESITVFHARRQEYAGYLEQEVSLLDGRVLGTSGFRTDGNSDFGEEVNPSWSVAIPISEIGVTLRGSYSEGFRAPSFDELFFPMFGNPHLGPEVSSEYDGGVTKTFGEWASFTATYFSRRVHSLILPVPCVTFPGCETAANAGRVDVQGVELVPEWRVTRDFTLSGNFTVIDETHQPPAPPPLPLKPIDVRPIRVPKHSASALAQYTPDGIFTATDHATVSFAYTFFGDRDDLDPMTDSIRNHVGYHRFDAVASYSTGLRWGQIRNEEVFARVQNLFDRNYAEAFGFKAPPINAVGGVKLDF